VHAFSDTRAWHDFHRDARAVDALVDVVADRAGFVDNEPSFTNGSPVTKPGRLHPCLVLDVLLLDRLNLVSNHQENVPWDVLELRSLDFVDSDVSFPGLASF